MLKKLIAAISLTFLLSACSSPRITTVLLQKQFYEDKTKTIGIHVVTPKIPKVKMPGAYCLLCQGVAGAANSSLATHTKTLSRTELKGFDAELMQLIEEKGMTAQIVQTLNLRAIKDARRISDPVKKFARKRYNALKDKLNVDYLLLIDIYPHIERKYSGMIANGGPTGTVTGKVIIVDLATNEYKLYKKLEVRNAPIGEWDEPPKFPGVTNSYYTAIEQAKELIGKFLNSEVNGTSAVPTNR